GWASGPDGESRHSPAPGANARRAGGSRDIHACRLKRTRFLGPVDELEARPFGHGEWSGG
ncbi:MAG: hypothetical protein WBE80_08070, partial [Methylocella sp.]